MLVKLERWMGFLPLQLLHVWKHPHTSSIYSMYVVHLLLSTYSITSKSLAPWKTNIGAISLTGLFNCKHILYHQLLPLLGNKNGRFFSSTDGYKSQGQQCFPETCAGGISQNETWEAGLQITMCLLVWDGLNIGRQASLKHLIAH